MMQMEGERQPFGAWVIAQGDRTGLLGDLAKVARTDRLFPKRGDPEAVRKHLRETGADGDAFAAIDDAELDWLAY